MSSVKGFKINTVDASITLATDLEDGLMSSLDHQTFTDITSTVQHIQKYLDFLNIGIDTSIGVLRINGNMYKLITYEGDAMLDEFVDTIAFVSSSETVNNSEFQTVITDSEDNILYGLYIDGTETNINLYGITVTNPSTGDVVTLSSVINLIK